MTQTRPLWQKLFGARPAAFGMFSTLRSGPELVVASCLMVPSITGIRDLQERAGMSASTIADRFALAANADASRSLRRVRRLACAPGPRLLRNRHEGRCSFPWPE